MTRALGDARARCAEEVERNDARANVEGYGPVAWGSFNWIDPMKIEAAATLLARAEIDLALLREALREARKNGMSATELAKK